MVPDNKPVIDSALVTGGAGFIGSHIVEELSDGQDVTVLDDFSTGYRSHIPDDVTVFEGNIRDEPLLAKAIADVDVVFHQAAIVSVEQSVDNPTQTHDINVEGDLNVLEAARKHNTRVVVASSAAIYGHPETIPIAETHPKEPTSPYGIGKLAVDHYTRRYNDLYGLDTVALRYFNVYGPRQRVGDYSGVISIFREQASTDDPFTVDGDGTQTRDFVHVDDVVRANLLAATTDHVGKAFNVGTGNATTINDLARTVRNVSESDSDIVYTDPRPGDIDHSRANISKARNQLGFEPRIDLETGLKTLF